MLNSRIKYINREQSNILNISQSYETFMWKCDNITSIKREIISEEMMTTMRHYYKSI